jgi:hypothetical protein
MPIQTCPRCGTRFEIERGWAHSALSLLMPAPAVPDMATQVRCPNCGHVFGEGEVRHLAASSHRLRIALVALLALCAFAWAISQVI